MKTPADPRHQKRKIIVKELFSDLFQTRPTDSTGVLAVIKKNQKSIDQKIASAAPQWGIDKINKIDLSILRLAVWELTIEQKTPPKVIVDEAVELGKRYGSENSASFINGVLGNILNNQKAPNE